MEILKLYHNPKKDILNTIADIVNTLEQARDLMQNMQFGRTRVNYINFRQGFHYFNWLDFVALK